MATKFTVMVLYPNRDWQKLNSYNTEAKANAAANSIKSKAAAKGIVIYVKIERSDT